MKRYLFIVKIFVVWFLFTPIAIINGTVRNYVYQSLIGELAAHQLSTLIGVILFFFLVFFMMKKEIVGRSQKTNFLIGLSWVMMTIIFEFLFGHYIAGHSWEKLFFDYNILEGRVWSLFLISVLFIPLSIKVFFGKKEYGKSISD